MLSFIEPTTPQPDIPEGDGAVCNIKDPRDSDYVDDESLNDPSVVETMTSSRIMTFASPSLETKLRVVQLGPNHSRCLIENCSDLHVVEYCHCVAKNFTLESKLMSNIEWHWNMKYYSLNLNSSHNIFCGKMVDFVLKYLSKLLEAGVALHRLFDRDRYLIVPEAHIIDRYHGTLTFNGFTNVWTAKRELFPALPNREDYQYTLIPVEPMMTEIVIHRQIRTPAPDTPLASTHFTTYVYPFADLPPFKSHLHPKFVILEAGRKLSTNPAYYNVIIAYPILAKVLQLYLAWTRAPPYEAKSNGSYNQPSVNDNDEDDSSKRDNYNEADTDGGRLRIGKKYIPGGGSTPGASGSKHTAHGGLVSRQRKNFVCLSEKSLIEHERALGKGKRWASYAVQVWFKKVLEQAPPPQMSVE